MIPDTSLSIYFSLACTTRVVCLSFPGFIVLREHMLDVVDIIMHMLYSNSSVDMVYLEFCCVCATTVITIYTIKIFLCIYNQLYK